MKTLFEPIFLHEIDMVMYLLFAMGAVLWSLNKKNAVQVVEKNEEVFGYAYDRKRQMAHSGLLGQCRWNGGKPDHN